MSAGRSRQFRAWTPYVSIVVIYAVTEGMCSLALRVLQNRRGISYSPNPSALTETQQTTLRNFLSVKKGKYITLDPVLGWVMTSENNAAGMRDDREYEKAPPPGTVRISAFGDSFTYGSDVKLGETWEKQLARSFPSFEILNYGVGAYGLDQAHLRYLKVGAEYHPHVLFIGYMSENLTAMSMCFARFYSAACEDEIFTKLCWTIPYPPSRTISSSCCTRPKPWRESERTTITIRSTARRAPSTYLLPFGS